MPNYQVGVRLLVALELRTEAEDPGAALANAESVAAELAASIRRRCNAVILADHETLRLWDAHGNELLASFDDLARGWDEPAPENDDWWND